MELREKLALQIEEIKKSLYGIDEIIKIFCLSKAADLTVLMLGEHAIAKSSLARDWSTTTGLDFRIVTSSEVDESLLAYIDPSIFRDEHRVQMRRGELMERDHILVDEFFLWSNKYRAKLHQLLEEKTYAGLSILTKTYTFATNPITEHYAGQQEERNLATEDRIDLLLPMYQPAVQPTQKMMMKFNSRGRHEVELQPVLIWDEYLKARKEIMEVEIPPDLIVWLTLFVESMSACKHTASKFDISRAKMTILCAECNQRQHLCAKVALSKPRFLRATILLCKALAWFDGREMISEDDIFTAVKYTLPHRVIFLQEEKTIFEAATLLPTILQEFIDSFNNWTSRNIFGNLENLIQQARRASTPYFDQEAANALQSEVSEDLAINNFVREAVEGAQRRVKKSYREILERSQAIDVEDIKGILNKSGLNIYDKGQLLEEFVGRNEQLTFHYELDRRNEKTLELIVDSLRTFLKDEGVTKGIPTRKKLLFNFKKEIAFSSDLITIKEERGRIRVTASNPKLKEKFEKLLVGTNV